MKGVKKQHLPEKLCATCGRSFAWRKKWERVWDEVKFCSDRCRIMKGKARANLACGGPCAFYGVAKSKDRRWRLIFSQNGKKPALARAKA